MMIPFSPSLPFFFGLCAISGWAKGSIDAGGNVLCLDIWQGEKDSGPYMHSIHFAFAFGAFGAPILAENFLHVQGCNTNSTENRIGTDISHPCFVDEDTVVKNSPGIEVLYPILGTFTLFVSIGYLAYGIKDLKEICQQKTSCFSYKELNNNEKTNSNNCCVMITVILMFLFLYDGMEVMYGTYIGVFSVQSNLHLTRQWGARVTAVFWGSFASMRFLAIFVAVKLSPFGTLVFSFVMSVVGSTLLAIFGDSSIEALNIFTAFMGIGMASIYASSMLWMDQYMTVTNKIGSLMTISASIGADSFPLFLGQFIDTFPMILMYMQVGVVYACILLFMVACWIGRRAT